MLQDMYKSYVTSASLLGDYNAMSKTELANGYCDADDAHDEQKRDQYYSALMLRYWYKIYDFSNSSHSLKLELDDFASWVSESLNVGLKYRRWRDSSHPLYTDPNGPDKIFNRSFYSTRQRWYKYFNQDKRRVDHFNSVMLEDWVEPVEDDFMSSTSDIGRYADRVFYESGNYSTLEMESSTYSLVQHFINRGKILEAIIVDSIAHQVNFDSKKGFDNKKVVKLLNSLDGKYISYFESTYRIDKFKINDAVTNIVKLPNRKLYKYIDNTLEDVRNDEMLVSMLKG
jgi:hypothetical protein